jgi:hypothetical protein
MWTLTGHDWDYVKDFGFCDDTSMAIGRGTAWMEDTTALLG